MATDLACISARLECRSSEFSTWFAEPFQIRLMSWGTRRATWRPAEITPKSRLPLIYSFLACFAVSAPLSTTGGDDLALTFDSGYEGLLKERGKRSLRLP